MLANVVMEMMYGMIQRDTVNGQVKYKHGAESFAQIILS